MDKYAKTDAIGQGKVMPKLKELFSGFTTTFEQHYEDKGTVDIFFTASTQNESVRYAVECKDRYYKHTDFDEWMIEKKKYKTLQLAKDEGYRPIYVNTYTDNWIDIWNLDKCSITVVDEWELPKKTLDNAGNIKKSIYLLKSSDTAYSSTLC